MQGFENILGHKIQPVDNALLGFNTAQDRTEHKREEQNLQRHIVEEELQPAEIVCFAGVLGNIPFLQ
ncbi:hypothetical protein D3C87_1627500 [compost metagenome]